MKRGRVWRHHVAASAAGAGNMEAGCRLPDRGRAVRQQHARGVRRCDKQLPECGWWPRSKKKSLTGAQAHSTEHQHQAPSTKHEHHAHEHQAQQQQQQQRGSRRERGAPSTAPQAPSSSITAHSTEHPRSSSTEHPSTEQEQHRAPSTKHEHEHQAHSSSSSSAVLDENGVVITLSPARCGVSLSVSQEGCISCHNLCSRLE